VSTLPEIVRLNRKGQNAPDLCRGSGRNADEYSRTRRDRSVYAKHQPITRLPRISQGLGGQRTVPHPRGEWLNLARWREAATAPAREPDQVRRLPGCRVSG